MAGAAAILSTYPLETLRTRMSIAGGSVSITGGIQQIWQQQGIAGFYQVPDLPPDRLQTTMAWRTPSFLMHKQAAAPSWGDDNPAASCMMMSSSHAGLEVRDPV